MIDDRFAEVKAALSDRYALEQEVGVGGMATVYRARDAKHGRTVAVKVLLPEVAAAIGSDRFLKEIEVQASLTHPHILGLHDSGEADGFLYYVMPFVDGESLAQRLQREGPLPVETATSIARSVAGALDYAHRQGVLHRDIKPDNILLQDGQPLIADFGIALALHAADQGRLTRTGMAVGTPAYMSPEQAAGEAIIDARTDVYALGCVLYEMLTGRPPFAGDTAQAILAKKLTESPPEVTSARDSVPPEIAAAVHTAMTRLPADRFASAADFARALGSRERARQGLTLPRFAVTTEPRWLGWALAAALLVTTGLAVAGWLQGRRPEVRPLRLAVPTAGVDPSPVAVAPLLAVSPNAEYVAYVGRDSVGRRIYLKHTSEPARAIPGSEGALSPFFSPDGRWLGFAAAGQIWRVPTEGGVPIAVTIAEREVLGAAWLLDDRIVFSEGYRSGLIATDVNEGGRDTLTIPDPSTQERIHARPSVIRGTSVVLFDKLREGQTAQVWGLNTDTRESRPLIQGANPAYSQGSLFFTRATSSGTGNTLFAARFDVRRLQVISGAVPVLEGIGGGGFGRYALSASGTLIWIAQPGPRLRRLLLVDLEGGQEEIVPDRAVFRAPAVSPDGTQLVVERNEPGGSELWLYDLATGASHQLTTDGGALPIWTNDGARVVFVRGNQILSLPQQGGVEDTVLTVPADQNVVWPLNWTGDGELLYAAVSGGETLGDILRAGPGQEPIPVLASELPEWPASLSPGENRLAFTHGPYMSNMRVYLTSYPVIGPRVTVSGPGAYTPKWSPDGDALYFVENRRLVRVEIGENGVPLQDSRLVIFTFDTDVDLVGASFSVHPDGRHLVVAAPVPAPPPELMIITDFAQTALREGR